MAEVRESDSSRNKALSALTSESLAEAVEADGRALQTTVVAFEQQVRRFASTTEVVERGTPAIHTRSPSVPVGLFAVGEHVVAAFDVGSDEAPEVADLLRVYMPEGRDLRLLPNPLAHHKGLSRWITDLYLSHRGKVSFVEVIEQPGLVSLAFEVSHGAGRPARRHLIGLDITGGLSAVKIVRNPMPTAPVDPDFKGLPELDQAQWLSGERTNAYYNHVQIGPIYAFIEWGALKIRDHLDMPRGTADLVIEAAADPDHSIIPDRYEMLPTADANEEVLVRLVPEEDRPAHYIYYRKRPRRLDRVDVTELEGLKLPKRLGKITSMFVWSGGEMVFLGGLPARPVGFREAPSVPDLLYVFQREDGPYALHHFSPDSRKVLNSFADLVDYTLSDDGILYAFHAPDGERDPSLEHVVSAWMTPFRSDSGDFSATQQRYLRSFRADEVEGLTSDVRGLLSTIRDRDFRAARDALDQILVNYPFVERASDVRAGLNQLHESLGKCVAVETELEDIWAQRRETFQEFSEEIESTLADIKPRPSQGVKGVLGSIEQVRTLLGRLEQLSAERHLPDDVIREHRGARKKLTDSLSSLSEAGARYADRAIDEVRGRTTEAEAELPSVDSLVRIEQLLSQTRDDRAALTQTVDALKLLTLEPERSLAIAEKGTAGVVGCDRLEGALTKSRRGLSHTERHGAFQSYKIQLDLRIATEPASSSDVDECVGRADALVAEIESAKVDYADFPELIAALDERIVSARRRFEARKLELMRQREQASREVTQQFDLRLGALKVAARTANLSAQALEGFVAAHAETARCLQLIEELRKVGLEGQASKLKGLLDQTTRLLVAERQERDIFSVEGETLVLGGVRLHRNRLELGLQEHIDDEGVGLSLSGTGLVLRGPRLGGISVPPGYQGHVNETEAVSRAEYLAYRIMADAEASGGWDALVKEAKQKKAEALESLTARCRTKALSLAAEENTLGLHDKDAALILRGVVPAWSKLGRLRFAPDIRIAALRAWSHITEPQKATRQARAIGSLGKLFGGHRGAQEILGDVLSEAGQTAEPIHLEYLEMELEAGGLDDTNKAAVHPRAQALADAIAQVAGEKALRHALDDLGDIGRRMSSLAPEISRLLRSGTLEGAAEGDDALAPEVTWLIARGEFAQGDEAASRDLSTTVTIKGLMADHPRAQGSLTLDLPLWHRRMERFHRVEAPAFERFRDDLEATRRRLTDEMELDSIVPRPLVRFAWTRLLRRVYLPLIAQALMKQLGSLDTPGMDQMGLLLLVSPPGYGKTELLKKVASLLGYAFISVSGTALGKATTSLDPAAAPDSNAASALRRLTLGLELRDNLILDIEDVQACSHALLEKLLPLCDATRTVEIVRDGEPLRVNLQGRRVAIVMTLNPLRATIPQALANRATLINLGDVADRHSHDFAMSYLEVAGPVNPTLEPVAANRDLETMALALEDGREFSTLDADLNGRYAPSELSRFKKVLEHAIAVRDVVMAVNRACLHSATVADTYRTEPAFDLQGSYRDMVEICRTIEPDWTPEQRKAGILRHYEGQAGLLAEQGEANLLVLKSLVGGVTDEERERLAHIRHTFRLHQQREQTLLTLLDRLSEMTESVQRIPASVNAHSEALASHLDGLLSTFPERQAAVVQPRWDRLGELLAKGLLALRDELRQLQSAVSDGSISSVDAFRQALASLSHDVFGESPAPAAPMQPPIPPTPAPEAPEAAPTPQSASESEGKKEGGEGDVEPKGDVTDEGSAPISADELDALEELAVSDPEAFMARMLDPEAHPVDDEDDKDEEKEGDDKGTKDPADDAPPEGDEAPEGMSLVALAGRAGDDLLLPRAPDPADDEASATAQLLKEVAWAGAGATSAPSDDKAASPSAPSPQAQMVAATHTRAEGVGGAFSKAISHALQAATLKVTYDEAAPPRWLKDMQLTLEEIRQDIDRMATAAEQPRPKTDLVSSLKSLLKALPDD